MGMNGNEMKERLAIKHVVVEAEVEVFYDGNLYENRKDDENSCSKI